MPTGREQELVDILFQIAFCVKEHQCLHEMNQEDFAAWVAAKLKGCGYPTYQCGASWGMLDKVEET